MTRTNHDLRRLLTDLETDQVERKESLKNVKDKVCQAICAFANDMPDHRASGVIFIGATDDGRPAGLTVDDRLLLELADLRDQARLLPPPIMTVSPLDVDGQPVAVIEVAPSPSPSPPVRFNGQVWIRVGPRRAIATADEERRLAERRRSGDLPFDSREATGSNLEDLDLGLFEREYLPSVVDPEILEANGRSIGERLTSLRLTSADGTPTNAGLLIIGAEPTEFLPGAYIQFLRVDGTDLADPIIDDRRLTSALPSLLRELDELLRLNIRTAVKIGDDLRDSRQPDYPLAALQQLTRNAVLHRSYEGTSAPGADHLVQRPSGDLFPGRAVWCCHDGELRPAGCDRLSQSGPRGSDGQSWLCADVRGRPTDCSPDPPGERQPTARAHTRAGLCWCRRPGDTHVNVPVITFFNNKGGVGKTSLVYHLAWMMARKGLNVVAADLDPQANLTANFLDEDQLEALWPTQAAPAATRKTIFGSVAPLMRAVGDIDPAPLVTVGDRLSLVPGDLALSRFEDDLSSEWARCIDGNERAFRVISAFWRLLVGAAAEAGAGLVLVDVGPNLGAINRSALVAADHVVIPLGPDLFSVQGLQNLGPTLRRWRGEWTERVPKNPAPGLELPAGAMAPAGYVLLGHGVRLGRPVKAYERWMARIPEVYRSAVLDLAEPVPPVHNDSRCLGQLRHYHSLMPLAYEARKPVFSLKPADGAFGGHQTAVAGARADFDRLADRILAEIGQPAADQPAGTQ